MALRTVPQANNSPIPIYDPDRLMLIGLQQELDRLIEETKFNLDQLVKTKARFDFELTKHGLGGGQ